MKKFLIIASVIVVLAASTILVWILLIDKGDAQAEASQTPSPSITASVETQKPEELALDEKMELAPEIEGAKKVIQVINGLRRVTYVAEAGNPYGVEAGAYIGEYKKEVTFEGKETGGVALVPKVAEQILLEQIAALSEEEGKWLIPMPLDISDMKTLENVFITIENGFSPGFNDACWAIKIGEPVSFSNTIPGKNDFLDSYSRLFPGMAVIFTKLGFENFSSEVMERGKEMLFITSLVTLDDSSSRSGFHSFGESFGNTSNRVTILFDWTYGFRATYEKIFQIHNVPVFIISN